MKFVCDRKNFSDALSSVGYVASQRNIKPILQDIKIEALDDNIVLSATDLEVSIRYRITPKEVEEQGVALVPASKIVKIFKEVSDDEVSFHSEKGVCVLNFSNCHFKLYGEDPEQFPSIPSFEPSKAFSIETKLFTDMIHKSIFSTSKDDIRYAMNGILFDCADGKLTMVGTDGRRLAISSFEVDLAKERTFSVIVPKKGMEQFGKTVGSDEEKIELNIDENQILIKTAKAEVCSRLIEGEFPDYRKVIPATCDKKVKLDLLDFISAVKQCSIVTDPDSRVIKLIFRDKELVMIAHPPDGDEAVVKRDIEYKFDELSIHFNPDFLMEGLKVIDKEENFIFNLEEKLKPGIITNDKDYTYLLMPLNIEERNE